MGIELYECVFAVDDFNLSKIPHDFAYVILQSKTLAPMSIKIFTTRLLMNKCFLKSCLFRILNLGTFCDNFIFQLFNWYVSFSLPLSSLFAPSILLSSTTFMVFSWRQTLTKWTTLLQFKHVEFIALHSLTWFGLKGKPHLLHFFLSSFFFLGYYFSWCCDMILNSACLRLHLKFCLLLPLRFRTLSHFDEVLVNSSFLTWFFRVMFHCFYLWLIGPVLRIRRLCRGFFSHKTYKFFLQLQRGCKMH